MSRILIISPNWIGDAVMAQPLLQLLRQQQPECRIDVLAPSWVAPVWRAMSMVDQVIESPFKHGMLQLSARWQFARRLRRNGYSAAYVLPNTLKFALIPWLAGIPRRIGYRGEMRYGLLNVIHHDDRAAPRPMVAFYAALAMAPSSIVQAPLPRPLLSITVQQLTAVRVQLDLPPDAPLIAFAPGAEFGSAKRWPPAHFAQLAQLIMQRDDSARIILLGSAKDRAVCDQIVKLAPQTYNLAGTTTLDQAIALLAQAQAVVSNDSGLLHIASALNRPIVALYGPTDPAHAPPFSDVAQALSLQLDCSPCRQRECPLGHQNCMQKMSSQLVWQALQPMLAVPQKAGYASIN